MRSWPRPCRLTLCLRTSRPTEGKVMKKTGRVRRGLGRRSFLKGTGAASVLGAIAGPRALAASELAGSESTAVRRRLGLLGGQRPVKYDFDEVISRVGTESVRWDKANEDFGTAIEAGMGVADMDFRAPPCVTQALDERCAHENWGYQHRGSSYAEAVAAWNHRRYGLDIDPGNVVFTTGVHPGLIAALHTFSPPGTRVLLLTPTYSGFYTDTKFTRTVAEDCPLVVQDDGSYAIDFDDFERRAQRCNSFILCNPQNPTGNCWSEEDMLKMGEICLRHRVVVLSDEIHCDFVTKGNKYTPFASLDDSEIVNNSITFKSGSKSFSLAAMKVAWYHTTNADFLTRIKENTRADLSTLGMIAMRAALTEGDDWLDQLLPYLDANHDYAVEYVHDLPMVGYVKAQGTYLAWLEVSELIDRLGAVDTARHETEKGTADVTPEKVLQRWLAMNASVFLNPGSNYGTGGAGRMRLNLASPRSVLTKALDNMSEAISGL